YAGCHTRNLRGFPTRRSSDLKAAGGVSAAHFLSGAGGTGRRAASLGVKMATLGLYYYPVYRYTYRGETYEQIGNVPAMEEQARRSEEHTSELQSRFDIVCRLL